MVITNPVRQSSTNVLAAFWSPLKNQVVRSSKSHRLEIFDFLNSSERKLLHEDAIVDRKISRNQVAQCLNCMVVGSSNSHTTSNERSDLYGVFAWNKIFFLMITCQHFSLTRAPVRPGL
ncbi:hypothetical protein NPIL_641431 [Nephila pilipes]|uniref:Uncharacterized protein n=1 Tax=Nephila pilipes TaxID=299642 RepID=A0A8X6MS88_NEPPI|nr:hypothetical protein NPIL_641431 [Nephila pilipes]